jgi:hypothetical protein
MLHFIGISKMMDSVKMRCCNNVTRERSHLKIASNGWRRAHATAVGVKRRRAAVCDDSCLAVCVKPLLALCAASMRHANTDVLLALATSVS